MPRVQQKWRGVPRAKRASARGSAETGLVMSSLLLPPLRFLLFLSHQYAIVANAALATVPLALQRGISLQFLINA